MNTARPVCVQGNDVLIVGAYPVEFYQRWVHNTLAASQA
jgi:hypothetical protein